MSKYVLLIWHVADYDTTCEFVEIPWGMSTDAVVSTHIRESLEADNCTDREHYVDHLLLMPAGFSPSGVIWL